MKNIIWSYWENVGNSKKPAHIELCHELLNYWCKDSFDIRILKPEDIKKYLPNNEIEWEKLESPAHRADYLRIALLYEHGGIWIDADAIITSDLQIVSERLKEFDIVAFEYRSGTLGDKTTFRSPIGFLATRPKSVVFGEWLKKVEEKLTSGTALGKIDWHSLGREIFNPLLKEFVEKGLVSYFPIHAEKTCIPIKCAQRKDFFKSGDIRQYIFDDEYQFLFIYFNSWMPELKNYTREELLSGSKVICKLFQYAYYPENRESLLNLGVAGSINSLNLPNGIQVNNIKSFSDNCSINLSKDTVFALNSGKLQVHIKKVGRQKVINNFDLSIGATSGVIEIVVRHDDATVIFGENVTGRYRLRLHRKSKVVIGDETTSQDIRIFCDNSEFVCGSDCMFFDGVLVQSSDQHGIVDIKSGNITNRKYKSITLGDHVLLGRQSIITSKAKVGDGSVIEVGSLVASNIPANSVAIGAPARVVKTNHTWCRNTKLDSYSKLVIENNCYTVSGQKKINSSLKKLLSALLKIKEKLARLF